MDLLKGILEQFVELGKQGIEITKVWAKSSTVPGIKLSEDLGFKSLGYINNEQIGFVLDLRSKERKKPLISKYLRLYQEAHEQWKKQENVSRRKYRTLPDRKSVPATG